MRATDQSWQMLMIFTVDNLSPIFMGSTSIEFRSWGLRPRLYASACLAG
jgi:hypothetical protein